MDKRKQNGGHSTKAKGVDKRKNNYKTAVQDAIKPEDVVQVLKKALIISLSDDKDRLKAMQFVLEYTLGKPKESIDLKTKGSAGIDFNSLIKAIKSED